MQPDVYCRRLGLQVPVAVSVKTGQMADVFHAICSIAISPYVYEPDLLMPSSTCSREVVFNPTGDSNKRSLPVWGHFFLDLWVYRNSAVPGNSDRALSSAARIRTYVKMCTLFGGISAGLFLLYRTMSRPGSIGGGWSGSWLNWLIGSGRRGL